MSLTRTDWEEVWSSVKRIEKVAAAIKDKYPNRTKQLLKEVDFLKSKVEQVIGQME